MAEYRIKEDNGLFTIQVKKSVKKGLFKRRKIDVWVYANTFGYPHRRRSILRCGMYNNLKSAMDNLKEIVKEKEPIKYHYLDKPNTLKD